MQVKDVMTSVVGSIPADSNLRDAVETMKALNLDPVPVVDDEHVVGVVSENDLQRVAQKELLGTAAMSVRDVMSPKVVCCSPEEDVDTAIRSLADQGCRNDSARVPVIDARRRLVGMVSVHDLRRSAESTPEDASAAGAIESLEEVARFDDDQVDFMSAESFPASDPIPPPSTIGPTKEK